MLFAFRSFLIDYNEMRVEPFIYFVKQLKCPQCVVNYLLNPPNNGIPRELLLVALSWLVVGVVSGLSLAGW